MYLKKEIMAVSEYRRLSKRLRNRYDFLYKRRLTDVIEEDGATLSTVMFDFPENKQKKIAKRIKSMDRTWEKTLNRRLESRKGVYHSDDNILDRVKATYYSRKNWLDLKELRRIKRKQENIV